MSTVNNGPQIARSGLVLDLDASSVTSYSAIAVYKVECYSTYNGGLRSANYTVQYSDDNSTWTTAFTGVMSNNSSCGIITGTNRNDSNYGKHRYWRYVEGAAVAGHHPRVSRIDFITKSGAVYNLTTYTTDNCADSGTYIVGTVSKDFGTTTWRDLSGNGNNGTLTNGPTFNGSNGGSIVFDGVDDSISCGTNTVLNVGNNISVNIWFYINLIPDGFAGYQPIVSKVLSDFSVGWEVANSSGLFRTTFRPSATQINLLAGSLVVGKWYMGTMTFDNVTVRLYLNGIETGSTTTGGPVILNSNQPLQIGTRGAGNFFNGNITQVSIYNRALTATEVLQNFNATKTRFGL